ncbi:arylsulfatase [Pseudomonas alkylphenolica]|uniref:Arylsulfatase n=1 Tax=Pseudomonas alkylphenolica TaxID=237609 RepID=A0A443ZEI5_9PSED|nr:arylsulfatase [Pseudomonas alkylphenolica]RWU17116.1 arylsulfatase [Pseudomonas alkylphenolica]
MKHRLPCLLLGVLLSLPCLAMPAKPNIVLIMVDNLAYGELGAYGGGVLRGAETPRIDTLASEGMRLTNFNVEPQCTPSRSALMTGRFPIRSGTSRVPGGGAADGLTLWEVTLAELLAGRGYATGIWGKWHLGSSDARLPTQQGFDEFYGVPRTYDEAMWSHADDTHSLWPAIGSKQGWDEQLVPPQSIYDARRGEAPRKVKTLNLASRRTLDEEIADRASAFIKRNADSGTPFFAFISFSLMHMPTQPNPAFAGKTGNGSWADALAEMDYRTGQLLDTLTAAGVADNTLVIFTSDNGGEAVQPWAGANGPWRGTYFTAMEASLRAPFILRWPGHSPRGKVSNEVVHIVDLYTTLAHAGGAQIPTDRAVDGVDQLDYFSGKQPNSNREGFPAYVADRLQAVKWRNWKLHFYQQESMFDPPLQLSAPRLYNLLTDLREEQNVIIENSWALHPMMRIVADFKGSLKQYPPIEPGTPDPYTPPR